MLREVCIHIRSLFKALFTGFISFWVIFGVLLKPIGPLYAVLVALGAAFVSAIIAALVPKLSKKCAAQLALWVITRAAKSYMIQVEAEGIGEKEGNLIIRLSIRPNDRVNSGDRLDVINTATKQRLGVIEVLEVEEASCACQVFDRIDTGFWGRLEARARTDPAPQQGVTYLRELPEGFWDLLWRLLRDW